MIARYVLVVTGLAFAWAMTHRSSQHDSFSCIEKPVMLDGRPHRCEFVTEQEIRCYPMMTMCR